MAGLTLAVCFAPLLIGCAYAIVVTMFVYRRVAEDFPAMRQSMRARRVWDLRYGAIYRPPGRFDWLVGTLPLYVIGLGGGLLAAFLFPPRGNPREDDPRALVVIVLAAVGALVVTAWAERWRSRRRYREICGYPSCPRCGYNLRGSPQRCPECGLRRWRPPADHSHPRRLDDADDDDEE